MSTGGPLLVEPLLGHLESCASDTNVKCVIVTGEGRFLGNSLDLAWLMHTAQKKTLDSQNVDSDLFERIPSSSTYYCRLMGIGALQGNVWALF